MKLQSMRPVLMAGMFCAAATGAALADEVVKASSFGWNPTDATKCLQAALDSGARKVVVDKQSSEWLVDMVFPRSNTEIVFEDGVVVRAIPGSMKNIVDNLFRCVDVTNVIMRGEGRAVLRMNREDYLDKTRYRHSEHRHAVALRNVENVVVRDLFLEDSGGDGVYVLNVKHALLENLVCSGHARQGTSLISVDDLTIRNCVFEHTKGALPECGMDIEPGRPTFNIGRVLIDNCVFCSNNCSGVAINVSNLGAGNDPMDVTYRNCRMFDNASRGVWLVLANGTHAPVKGSLRFEGCTMSGNGAGPLQINNLASDALHVSFKDCVFDASGFKGVVPPITLINGRIRDDLNNLTFEGCRLLACPAGRRPVMFDAMTGCGVLPGGAKGVLSVAYADGKTGSFDFAELERRHVPKPELRAFETGALDVRKLVPYNANGKADAPQNVAGYRGPFTFLQYVQKPGEYKIHFESQQIGKYAKIEISVEVYDSYGTPHDQFTITEPSFDYVLKAQGRNTIYRFEVRPGGRRMLLTSEHPGHGFVANNRIHWLTGKNQTVYFQAKAGAGDVKVELTMEPGEWVSAELIDPSGNVVDRCEKSSAGVVLIGKRPKDDPAGIWSMHVTRFVDDCLMRLGAATAGVYSYDKNLLLVEDDKSAAGGGAKPAAGDAVKASSFGWNPTNATKCLQAAFDSGARKVIVDKQVSEWLVNMVFPRSNTEIVFEDGVVVRARPGSMIRTVDNLFRCLNVSNVVMRGEGRAVLRMNRADYLDKTRYQHGEHRHAITLRNVKNVVVRDLTIEDSGGDGVYVLNVKHGLLENLVCSGHARQGTSVISTDDLTIRNCVFKHTKGALPECGMDIEPGLPSFNIGRVLIENCVFCSNNCSGVAINVSVLKDANSRMDVTYRNCRMFDNAQRGLWLVLANGTHAPVKGNLRFERCVMSGNGAGPLQINNLASDALHVSFKDCVFDASGFKGAVAPITLVNGRIRDDLNNLSFDGCRLLDCPARRNPVTFEAMTGCGVLPGGAKGVLPVEYADGETGAFDFGSLEKRHPPKPELRTFETGAVDIKKLVPYKKDGVAAGKQKPAGYRASFTFLQHVQKPGEYKIHFESQQIGKYSKIAVPVEVFDINGTPHDEFTITEQSFDYVLKAQGGNTIYRFVVRPSGRRVLLTSKHPGQGFVANNRVHWLTGRNQNIYFQAKAGAGDVKVELTMEAGEWVSAELIDPAGNVVDRCEKSSAGVVLVGKRPKDDPGGIWSMHVTRFMDDCHLRLGAATSGVYAYDKELLLVEE